MEERSCPDLTVIDLPGVTRVPVKGSDQKEDIERVTREMTLRSARGVGISFHGRAFDVPALCIRAPSYQGFLYEGAFTKVFRLDDAPVGAGMLARSAVSRPSLPNCSERPVSAVPSRRLDARTPHLRTFTGKRASGGTSRTRARSSWR